MVVTMTSAAFDSFPDEVPAEDWAEQHTEADPRRDDEPGVGRTSSTLGAEANEADVAEQDAEVFVDDEI
jgi:hypothetical protein